METEIADLRSDQEQQEQQKGVVINAPTRAGWYKALADNMKLVYNVMHEEKWTGQAKEKALDLLAHAQVKDIRHCNEVLWGLYQKGLKGGGEAPQPVLSSFPDLRPH